MLSTATTAWLTGFIALACLFILSISHSDQLIATSPLAQHEVERIEAADIARQCAGIVSSDALEDCLLTATPMSGDGEGMLVTIPVADRSDHEERS